MKFARTLFAGLLLAASLTAGAQELWNRPVVEWGADGYVLISSNGLLARFDPEDGKEELLDNFDDAFTLAPGGRRVAMARGRVIELRRYPGLALEKQVWPPEGTFVTALAWSPEGETLAAGSSEGRVLLWSVASGELWGDLETDPPGWVARLRFSGDGARLLAAFRDGRALLLDLAGQEVIHRFDVPRAAEDGAGVEETTLLQTEVLDLSADGTRVLATRATGEKSDILLLNEAGRVLWRRPGRAVEFTRDGAGVLALGESLRVAALYRASDAEALRTFEPPPEVQRLHLVRQSPNGKRLLAVGEDKRGQVLVLWNFETARLLAVHR